MPVLAVCRAMWGIVDWLGAAGRTGDAWVTEARIARLLADIRKAASDPPPHVDSGLRDPRAAEEQPHDE